MASVWWVEGGEYSGWHIKAIFSTKKKAEEYVRTYNASCPEEYRLAPDDIAEKPLDEPIPPVIGEWMVHLSVNGNTTKNFGEGQWNEDSYGGMKSSWIQRSDWDGNKWVKKDEPIFVGFGQTREHARRSAEDLRREYIAAYGKRYVPPPKECLHG